MQVILAIDQGTTNTKALFVDLQGRVVARASCPVGISFPQAGWVEQDASLIWDSVLSATLACLAALPSAQIKAIGITNQRETVVVWDRHTGQPVAPAIVWQCRRTVGACEELEAVGLAEEIRRHSGLALDPLFSASKIAWILGHLPNGQQRAADGQLCAGTVDSWLLWNLTGGASGAQAKAGHATDASNASRTQLLNIHTGTWDPTLLQAFRVPAACLPSVRPSSHIFGVTGDSPVLPKGIPIAALAGDSHAALFGHGVFAPGKVKATYGTGSSLMTLLPQPLLSAHGLSTTVAWALPNGLQHALEGNITNTGGAVDWLAAFLALPGGATQAAALAETVADAGGAYVVPAFAGLGAPHWDAAARGLFCGLTRGTTAAHVARATIESIAYQVADVFAAIGKDSGARPKALLTDGGASANNLLMQFQADILDAPVLRNESADVAALGVAGLAGLATGLWPSLEVLATLPRPVVRFEPAMAASRREALLSGWQQALQRASGRLDHRC